MITTPDRCVLFMFNMTHKNNIQLCLFIAGLFPELLMYEPGSYAWCGFNG